MPLPFTSKPPSRDASRTLRVRLAAWIGGPTLARDLSIVLVVKLVLLMALKYAFFNHPQADHMRLPPADVAARLLGPTTPDSAKGDHHDQ